MTHSPQSPTSDAAYYRQILHTLIDQGATLATHLHERALAATPTPENRLDADPSVAFDRVARAIRRTIALARHIAADPALLARAPQARTEQRARLIRGVEDAIDFKHRQTGQTDHLRAELAERLDDPALDLDLANRSVDEIIQEICRDLGVNFTGAPRIFQRRTPADIADLRRRAATPSRDPLATLRPRATPQPA